MGPDLGEFFHQTSSSLTWMHWRWKQYKTLFGEKPTRVDTLNRVAPFFFRVVQDVLFEDTILAIARLVGPTKSRGKRNLAVDSFVNLVPEGTLRSDLQVLVQKAKAAGAFATAWRNRYVAHRDLDLLLGTAAQPLPLASRASVEAALSALRDVLDRIEVEYCNATTAYTASPTPGDAESLLYVIRDGLLRQRDRSACWKGGERHEDDLAPPEAV